MANTIKVVNGYYAECDEHDTCVHTYWDLCVDQVKQIAFSGDKVVAVTSTDCFLRLYENKMLVGYSSFPLSLDYVQNIQLSGNTVILQTTSNETYQGDFVTNGIHWERV